ncbi:STAS domain-containing protein [Saccharothrix sp. 6-C]|uniref:Anti-anti-sigma factor n=1 Tax=Saccharothrix texasensis TaxID=103734 RepID=A0A3N1HID1_9PSEU|nr:MULTISPECIES: STAS domain-containing protein [Saccharothrix]QQQ74038.1 STAS domain-containing protein [Saccharothrix sp. 6-C]ROP42062.1 anti-anti-sigma factor [Saccharothrix texasensis]
MFHLTAATDGDVHTIALTGELDHRCTPRLHEALTRLRLVAGDRLVLDLAELTFCDSSGLTAFVVAHELAAGAVDLLSPPAKLVRMLRTTGLAELFTIRGADQGRPIR